MIITETEEFDTAAYRAGETVEEAVGGLMKVPGMAAAGVGETVEEEPELAAAGVGETMEEEPELAAADMGETMEEEPGASGMGETMEESGDGTAEDSRSGKAVPAGSVSGRTPWSFGRTARQKTLRHGSTAGKSAEFPFFRRARIRQDAVPTQRFHVKRMFEWLLPYLVAGVLVTGVGGAVLFASGLRTQRLYDQLQEQYGEYIADE